MKCILMNKNTEILVAEYDETIKIFTEVIEIKNIDYAPFILKKVYEKENSEDIRTTLTNWFRGRGIPTWRDKLDLLLYKLNINSPEELLNK